MSCACRTTSLRIFIQSLTELRVASSVHTPSARLHHLSSPITTFGRSTALLNSTTLTYHSARGFQSGRCLRAPADAAAESPSLAASDDDARDPSAREGPSPSPRKAHTLDIDGAKNTGAILDFTPESIDQLVANLANESGSEDIPLSPQNAADDPPSRRPKPAVGGSSLKRRKILKAEPKAPPPSSSEYTPWTKENWQVQKAALKEKFPEGWKPRKRLSPDALDGIRALHSQFPQQYTTEVLAKHFEISPEAIRRILKSKWSPSPEEDQHRQERWHNRGKNIWSHMAELGKKPPRKWRAEGIKRDPRWNEKRGPRTYWPYQPHREDDGEEGEGEDGHGDGDGESTQRKLSGKLF
ncbi:hypothetical protein F5Y18DRAFT_410906 [Xylariaceae sp. FL1019]|nr:hypothetical protein F5Y18DRAFT_410906 [Xylariaceae sp. FL1019]